MKRVVVVMAAALAAGAVQAQRGARADVDQAVCALLGTCDDASDQAASPVVDSPTRAFSFTRDKPALRKPAAARSGRRAPARPQTANYDLRVTFASGSADLDPASAARIHTFALALNDPRLSGRRARIEGHTDTVGDPTRNLDLSQRRARAVADRVAADGVDPARLDVEGYGATRVLPGVTGRDPANRRVVAALVK